MPFSQHTSHDRFGRIPTVQDLAEDLDREGANLWREGANAWREGANPRREGANPWREAAILLGAKARRHLGLIVVAALACAVLAGMAKAILPAAYKASAQILIDPQENRAYEAADAAASTSTLEANAAINYVESQMGVIGSERVLLRVIRDQGLAGEPAAGGEGAQESADARRARDLAENKALVRLQKAIKIQRAERSFLVNITATDKSPEKAAQLANAMVKAYGDVNTVDRNSAARWLATELKGRIEETRRQLGDTESKLLSYKTEHNLVGLHDKAITERRTTEATDALASAENREAQARARVKQLEFRAQRRRRRRLFRARPGIAPAPGAAGRPRSGAIRTGATGKHARRPASGPRRREAAVAGIRPSHRPGARWPAPVRPRPARRGAGANRGLDEETLQLRHGNHQGPRIRQRPQ